MSIWKTSSRNYFVVSEKHISHNMSSSGNFIKRQAQLDLGGYAGTILMDLSQAYHFLAHDLLITKLEARGLDIGSLNFLLDYLSLRKHRTKVVD